MIGDILLYAGLAGCVVVLVFSFFVCMRGRDDLDFLHTWGLRAVFVFLSLALLLMVYYFISDNFSIYYVWLYSSRDMPLFYKIAAVWAGQQGTFLLWAWISVLALLWLSCKRDLFAKRTLMISEIVVLLLVFLTILTDPFKLLNEFPHLAGAVVDDGAGIDPELLNPWMGFHPPVTFMAYATMLVPFAASVTYLVWQEGGGLSIALGWMRLSWLFFSLGVGLIGGFWTYEAGWGIWTWDASEAGSLVPWLLLTASLHQKKNKNVRAVLLVFTFLSVLFATFIIRSGLWGSVHEFTETSINSVLGAVIVIFALIAVWLIYGNKKKFELRLTISDLGSLVMVLMAVVVFAGLLIPLAVRAFGYEAFVGSEFYNLTCYPLALLLLILLGAYHAGRRGVLIGVLVFLASIALAFIRPSEAYWLADPTSPFYAHSSALTRYYASLSLLSMVPPVLFALTSLLLRVREMPGGASLIHLGVVLLFFSGVFTTSFDQEYTVTFEVDDIGTVRVFDVYELELSRVHVEQNQRGNWVQHATVEVREQGQVLGSTRISYLRDETGNYATSEIIRRPLRDFFITFPGIEPRQGKQPVIPLHIKVYSLLNAFWIGDILLSMGMLLIIMKKRRTNLLSEVILLEA